jgi:pyrroloquinoline quinone (PQQ) biosynthesis protein C
MPTGSFTAGFDRALVGRRLLDHPYYRSWQEGSLTMDDLRAYAHQYRHIEAVLPEVLAGAADATIDEHARALIEKNLADELSSPAPHVELFDRFAAAVGVEKSLEATPATSGLVGVYRQAASDGAVAVLAAIAAYETQAPEIASTKAEALRCHHGLAGSETEFWDIHARMELDHASWTFDALQSLAADQQQVEVWAERSAAAWWAFLDERDACRV